MRLLVAEFCSLANQNYAFLSVLRDTQAVVVARAEIPEGLRVVGSRRFFEPLYPLLVVNPNTDAVYIARTEIALRRNVAGFGCFFSHFIASEAFLPVPIPFK